MEKHGNKMYPFCHGKVIRELIISLLLYMRSWEQIMRKRLYNIIKSPTDGNPETTVYDYFMLIVIIVSLFFPVLLRRGT